MPRLLLQLRRLLLAMGRVRPRRLQAALIAPVKALARLFATQVSNRMLCALEVAIEYWLSLTFAADARALEEGAVQRAQQSAGNSSGAAAAVDEYDVRAELRQELDDEQEVRS